MPPRPGRSAGFDPAALITFAHHLDEPVQLSAKRLQSAWHDGAALEGDTALELALMQ